MTARRKSTAKRLLSKLPAVPPSQSSSQNSIPVILLAEDCSDDVYLMQYAAQTSGLSLNMSVVSDGQEAVDYLMGQGVYSDRKNYPFPDLLLLDLKMPRMHGFELLGWMAAHRQFERLPVVVLSSSDVQTDMRKAFELGADDYRVKPVGVLRLVQLLHELHARWLLNIQPSCAAELTAPSNLSKVKS